MFRILMKTEAAARRLNGLSAILDNGKRALYCTRNKSDGYVDIGGTKVPTKTPRSPLHVPYGFVPGHKQLPQSVIRHLKWMAQKDLLGQDIFLIGPPGPLRRLLAMQYLELTRRETEYIALSRDTTESDLKQRREIKKGSSYYIDQCAVRAALLGRVLVIEGVEKAERNVLPALNNLLENREMQLDDGRFLMHPLRYDKLLEKYSEEMLNSWQLVRVSDQFRVIALGLPVPKYRGNPLDPPLRSRFQARDIYHLPFRDQLEFLYESAPTVETNVLAQALSCASTLSTQESVGLGLPDFPLDNLAHASKILDKAKNYPVTCVFSRLYPDELITNKEGQTSVNDVYKKFEITRKHLSDIDLKITSIQTSSSSAGDHLFADVTFTIDGNTKSTITVPSGKNFPTSGSLEAMSSFVMTNYHQKLLADITLTHSVLDFCIIGGKGCGKTTLVKQFASMLGYLTEPVLLYQDMTARDLLQQRYTLPNGDTVWRYAPLVEAALDGRVAVLDGLHRVNPGTLSILQRLVHDRELTLHDGTRLLRDDKYDEMKQKLEITDKEMFQSGVLRIHPSFRIVALAEPPKPGSAAQQWLNPEMLNLFLYHHMPPLSTENEMEIIQGMVPGVRVTQITNLLDLCQRLRSSTDTNLQSIASSLSTRQLLRLSRRLERFLKTTTTKAADQKAISDAVHKACLSRFLPQLARTALGDALQKSNLPKEGIDISSFSLDDVTCKVKDGVLRIGDTSAPVYMQTLDRGSSTAKVPDIIFYDNPQHLSVMQDVLQDYLLGEHILLVGNQGVGKNKIVDQFLHLLNKPREYLQLHRDTTVQSLTVQPTVKGGAIVYEDSPLVKAVRLGHALVVDEADKAPTHVTCVLKNLLESGRATLADGRKIVSDKAELKNLPLSSKEEDIILMHPEFRMFVLANRPGFPFLGNDFFAAMGDVFSCHAVDNPSVESELHMLRLYGADVPIPVLKKLVAAFGELRNMADQGLISYPYSTREVVNIVKHLQQFPNEGLASVVRNVFDFDAYSTESRQQVETVMHKHGIPVGARPQNVQLSNHLPLPSSKLSGYWSLENDTRTTSAIEPISTQMEVKGPVYLKVQPYEMERVEDRSLTFSEQRAHWQIPNFPQISIVCDLALSKGVNGDLAYVSVVNTPGLFTYYHGDQYIKYMDLYDVFPNLGASMQASIKIAPLGNPLRGQVLLFEEKSHVVLVADTVSGAVRRLVIPGLDKEISIGSVANLFKTSSAGLPAAFKISAEHSDDLGIVVFYQLNGQRIFHANVIEGVVHSYDVPFDIGGFHMVSHDKWIVTEALTNRKYLLTNTSDDQVLPGRLKLIKEEGVSTGWGNFTGGTEESLISVSCEELSSEALSAAVNQSITSPNRVIVDNRNYAKCVVGFPDLTAANEVYSLPRGSNLVPEQSSAYFRSLPKSLPTPACLILPETSQVIRVMPTSSTPSGAFDNDVKPENANCLEVADLKNHKLFYVPVPNAFFTSPYVSWQKTISSSGLILASGSQDIVYTVDTSGCVREWETELSALTQSLADWRALIGSDSDDRHMQISSEQESGKDVTAPKHGKIDLKNAPHVGGNTWAGGTGGRDTAGLGGKGGPYRLDAGHDVTQLPDWEKDAVPEHVKKAAREMAEKAFQARLREIRMSEYDAQMYESFSGSVRRQVKSLRIILESLQAKGKERQWQRHQTMGELDDMKLIEGLTGERNIYKRRAEQEPEPGTPQQKPKRLRIVVDVSGSMYRFNGLDNRLERSMEAVCMVLESFEGYKEKFKYDVWGHSGDGYDIELVNCNKPPANNKERLEVLKTIHAHAQFCMSGDHTLEATEFAIESIKKEEADEYFVIVLSDANLERYGIRPSKFTQALTKDEEVNSFAIFIGSLGDQAERLKKQLPAGRSFVCLDTKNIPQIMQQIFTSTLLSTR